MGLYTKIDKQIEKLFEVVSINKSLSKQNFYSKILFFLLFIFNVYEVVSTVKVLTYKIVIVHL